MNKKLAPNTLVETPDGIGVVEHDDGTSCLVKFMPEHDKKWRAPCEFRVYKSKEIQEKE